MINRAKVTAARLVQRLPEPVRARLRGLVRGAPSVASAQQNGSEAPSQPDLTAASPSDDKMTHADIVAAYRLFHGRQPDPAGLDFFSAHVGQWSVRQMLPYFAHSDEFRNSDTYRVLLGGVSGDELIEVDRGDHRLLVPSGDGAIGQVLIDSGTYEPHLLEALQTVLEPGGTFVDCGANIGIITMTAAAAVGPTGRVVAFEALANNANLVRLSAALNGFDHVTVHHAAVADRPDVLVIDTAAGSNGIVNGPLRLALARSSPEVLARRNLVGSVRLDDALAGVDALDVLKIDIEGAEGLAIDGAAGVIDRFEPVVFLEYSPDLVERISSRSGAELIAWFTDRGYRVTVLDDNSAGLEAADLDTALKKAGLDHFDLRLDPTRLVQHDPVAAIR